MTTEKRINAAESKRLLQTRIRMPHDPDLWAALGQLQKAMELVKMYTLWARSNTVPSLWNIEKAEALFREYFGEGKCTTSD